MCYDFFSWGPKIIDLRGRKWPAGRKFETPVLSILSSRGAHLVLSEAPKYLDFSNINWDIVPSL